MAKYTNRNYQNEAHLVVRYRWEFLRRNKKYQEDYRNKEKRPLGYWGRTYGLATAYDPAYAIDDLPKGIGARLFLEQDIRPLQAITLKNFRSEPINTKDIDCDDVVNDVALEKPEILEKISTLEILVDITRRKELICYEFNRLIYAWQKKVPFRIRLEKYGRYLRTFDLRRQKKTLQEIARIVYPEEYSKLLKDKIRSEKYAVLPLIEKVKNNLKACQGLINGDYKIIR